MSDTHAKSAPISAEVHIYVRVLIDCHTDFSHHLNVILTVHVLVCHTAFSNHLNVILTVHFILVCPVLCPQ